MEMLQVIAEKKTNENNKQYKKRIYPTIECKLEYLHKNSQRLNSC